jgi:hypothetical protein
VADTATPKQYEFSLAETSSLDDLAAWMKIVAVCSVVFGVLEILAGIYVITKEHTTGSGLLTAVVGAAWLAIGAWLWGAAVSIKSVTLTEGNDVQHFIAAVEKLSKVYFLQAGLLGVQALFALVSSFI